MARRGCLSIRQAGGVTIAQDEESSPIFGMPRAAIELGAAQQVLRADGHHPQSQRPARGACAIADLASFAAVRDLIEERCGLRFDDSQRASLSASVEARMQQLGLVSEDEYFARLRGAAPSLVEAELRNLLNLVTVTETCFFRDVAQFRLLREHIIPTLMAERSARATGSRKIRIWSAGCSSGEEAYSIAITLDEMGLFQAYPDWSIEIIGTDLNTKALEKARRGVYAARAVRNVEGVLLDDHFVRDGKTFALSEAIKKRVTFEFGNLTQTPMPSTGPQDIVFCKNVAIYFSADVTRKLIGGASRHARARRLSAAGPRRVAVADVGRLRARRARGRILLQENARMLHGGSSPVATETSRTPALVAQGFSPVHADTVDAI